MRGEPLCHARASQAMYQPLTAPEFQLRFDRVPRIEVVRLREIDAANCSGVEASRGFVDRRRYGIRTGWSMIEHEINEAADLQRDVLTIRPDSGPSASSRLGQNRPNGHATSSPPSRRSSCRDQYRRHGVGPSARGVTAGSGIAGASAAGTGLSNICRPPRATC